MDEMEKLEKKPNFMTVPAAIKELEKIEIIRQFDGRYRLDHAVTATQKTILKAFQMDHNYIRNPEEEYSTLNDGMNDFESRFPIEKTGIREEIDS